jgi:hypothetical protein|tara:strand:+ start:225 stop:731 length:507 start_codon:yes stop_codon:yes gene_type:complete
MTKKLEELFNLEEQDKEPKIEEPTEVETSVVKAEEMEAEIKSVDQSYQAIQNITKDLPAVKELDTLGESDLDHLADKAEKAYDDLMDLGMNVEVRYSGRIFEVAGSMLKNAVDAKSAKIDKKLKAVDLQMRKLKLDQDSPEDPNEIVNGSGYVMLDRNELMKKLGGKE